MASVPVLIRRIRRARRECKQPPTVGRYRRYEAAYEEILRAVEAVGGEDALDAVGEWTLAWTHRQQRLPPPETVRAHAREVLEERGVAIPPESPLAT